MERFKYWDWEDTWLLFLMLIATAVVVLAGVAWTADHTVKSYYVERGSDGTPCIMSSINWLEDPKVFCTSDISVIAETLNKLNAELRANTERPR